MLATALSIRAVPGVIFVRSECAGLKIAGLTLLDRLIVTFYRAGAGSITVVCQGALPPVPRSRALGIPFRVLTEAPAVDGTVLAASADVLVQVRDVSRCMQEGKALRGQDGEPLPLGVSRGVESGTELMFDPLEQLTAEGVAWRVQDRASARAAEAALWASLTSSSDGVVDKVFNRPCGRPLSKLLIHTPICPNTVSICSILVGVAAAACFAPGRPQLALLGALLFQLSAVIDCVDGDLARVLFKESLLGKWLDLAGDQVVHVSVFAGLALGAWRADGGSEALWLGASAVAGALISFAVVVRGMRKRSGAPARLQRLIDAATNRDFSVLVFVLACLQQIQLFLWLAAVGSHLFWLAALGLQVCAQRSCRTE